MKKQNPKGKKATTRKKASIHTPTPDLQPVKKDSVVKKTVSDVSKRVDKARKEPLKNIKWLNELSRIAFMLLGGINRPIAPGHVTKVANSIDKLGCLQPIIVTEIDFINGKKQYYILDGQHKFSALLRLGMNVPYVVVDIKDKQELVEAIALLNASSKSWSMQDYVTAWSSLKEDYVKLNRYFEIYDFEIGILAQVLMNQSVTTSGSVVTKKIKKGEFTINNEKRAVEMLNYMTDVFKVLPRMNRFENKYACSEYVKFLNSVGCDYNHERFVSQLKKKCDMFLLATQEEGKLAEFFNKIK
ncbi:MAG: ParB/RepB/Spo0J family partition protein [Pseudomonadota bacterium]|jgi:hypothetical protein